jgi:YbbR domain-containing protein
MPTLAHRIVRSIFADFGIKIAALFMGAVLWFYAVSDQEQTRTLEVPVRVSGLEEGKARMTGETPRTVQVTVSGRGRSLLRVSGDDFKASINLKDAGETIQSYTIHSENIVIPPGSDFKVLRVEGGENIKLSVVRMGEKQVTVKVKHVGSPPPGYTYFIGFNVAANSRAMIQGSKEALAGVDAVETEPVDLTNRIEDFNVSVMLIPPKPEITIRDIDQVDLKIRIVPNAAPTEGAEGKTPAKELPKPDEGKKEK